jgi:hypothetical protein
LPSKSIRPVTYLCFSAAAFKNFESLQQIPLHQLEDMGRENSDQQGKAPSFSKRLPSKILASYFVTSKGLADQGDGKLPPIAPGVAGLEEEGEKPDLAVIIRKCAQQQNYDLHALVSLARLLSSSVNSVGQPADARCAAAAVCVVWTAGSRVFSCPSASWQAC